MRRAIAFAVGVLGLVLAQVSPATAATSGTQNWVVITTPGAPTRVVASGVLNAAGTVTDALTLNPNGTFDNLAVQTFPNGTLTYHGMGTFTLTVDPRSCVGRGDVVGPFQITGGTGAYAGATGSGTAFITLYFFFDRNPDGSCVQGPPARTYGVARAPGHLTLP
jgi:hypothetical protein